MDFLIERLVQIKIGMDVAASEFLTKYAKYDLNFKKQPNDEAHVLSAQSLCDLSTRSLSKIFLLYLLKIPLTKMIGALGHLYNLQLIFNL